MTLVYVFLMTSTETVVEGMSSFNFDFSVTVVEVVPNDMTEALAMHRL